MLFIFSIYFNFSNIPNIISLTILLNIILSIGQYQVYSTIILVKTFRVLEKKEDRKESPRASEKARTQGHD